MEVCKVSDANLIVYVHPSKSENAAQAVLHELSTLLFKYTEVFDGVVLAYEVSQKSTDAKILPSIHPYFGVRLKAKLLLFSPKPDMLLEGKVAKIGKESIHVIVLGFSSACITDEDVRDEFRYKTKHGQKVYASTSHKRHVIKVGSMIRFLVKSMDEEILHISGSLLPMNTGSIKWLDEHMEEAEESERTIKKRKMEGQNETLVHNNGFLDNNIVPQNNNRSSKKFKWRQSGEES